MQTCIFDMQGSTFPRTSQGSPGTRRSFLELPRESQASPRNPRDSLKSLQGLPGNPWGSLGLPQASPCRAPQGFPGDPPKLPGVPPRTQAPPKDPLAPLADSLEILRIPRNSLESSNSWDS